MRPTARIVVAATQVPFERGGAEWHADALVAQLRAHGYPTDLVQLPFAWDPRREALRSALAWRLLDLSRAGGVPIDLLIATRFPSYAARHPRKVVWLFHPFRQAYDLHEAGLDGFPDTPEGRELHRRVVELDGLALRECRRVFTTSDNNARRLRRYVGLEAEVLRLPLLDPESFRCEAFEPFVLSVGRLESLKRTDLLVRAMAHVPPPARAVIVGEGSQREALEALARECDVAARVEFRGRLTDAEVRALYARAGAVFYAPWDEDYGLVTLEAFHARKPVVTAADAGGVLEFVTDGKSGEVAEADPTALGARLKRLLADPEQARRQGESGYARVQGIRWTDVISRLTAPLRE